MEDMAVTPDFWRNRRVLITGHTGFKGAWLSLWLQELGAEVAGFALDPPTSPSLYELANIASGMDDHRGDVRDTATLREVVDRVKPEIIIHMAAQSLVTRSYHDPVGTYATNVMGTVNLLDAARHISTARVVIVVTSDKCYENHEWERAYRETDALGGRDPYSSSKGCAEVVTAAFRRSFFSSPNRQSRVAIASVRAGNVIGGGDWSDDRLIPDAVRAFLAGKVFLVRFPDAIRPWQYVLEPLRGYLLLAEKLFAGAEDFEDAWNFGPDTAAEMPVRYLAEQVTSLWGSNAQWQSASARPQLHEAQFLKLDSSKARDRLGWLPQLTLRQALDLTIEWYRAFHEGADLRSFSAGQIRRYTDHRDAVVKSPDSSLDLRPAPVPSAGPNDAMTSMRAKKAG